MSPIDATAISVAIIALISSWLTARTSSKAAAINSQTNARVEMEKEAYNRAREFDIDTIERQDKEIKELREENQQIREENRELKQRVATLSDRLSRLEKEVRHEE